MNTLDSVFDNQQDGARIGASMERCSRYSPVSEGKGECLFIGDTALVDRKMCENPENCYVLKYKRLEREN
jgi:hypothetical protein